MKNSLFSEIADIRPSKTKAKYFKETLSLDFNRAIRGSPGIPKTIKNLILTIKNLDKEDWSYEIGKKSPPMYLKKVGC